MMDNNKKTDKIQDNGVIVLFSGGQDSALCLALALEKYTHVYTLGFDYGQTHACELEARQNVRTQMTQIFPQWAARLKEDRILQLGELKILAPNALTGSSVSRAGELPATFVPGRNMLFFLYAAIWGYHLNVSTLMGGMCEVDYSGYPDCREETLHALEQSFKKGFLKPFILEAPLMHVTKAESWQLAHARFGQLLVELLLEYTHTCYRGVRQTRHIWGYGCGACDACHLRAKGYEGYRLLTKANK